MVIDDLLLRWRQTLLLIRFHPQFYIWFTQLCHKSSSTTTWKKKTIENQRPARYIKVIGQQNRKVNGNEYHMFAKDLHVNWICVVWHAMRYTPNIVQAVSFRIREITIFNQLICVSNWDETISWLKSSFSFFRCHLLRCCCRRRLFVFLHIFVSSHVVLIWGICAGNFWKFSNYFNVSFRDEWGDLCGWLNAYEWNRWMRANCTLQNYRESITIDYI